MSLVAAAPARVAQTREKIQRECNHEAQVPPAAEVVRREQEPTPTTAVREQEVPT